jgi:hypothetical protein
VLVYTTARVAVFAVVLVVLYALGMRQILLLATAVVVSGLLSYVLLGRLRDSMSAAVISRGESMRARFRERTQAEDAADDARRAAAAADQGAADEPPPPTTGPTDS